MDKMDKELFRGEAQDKDKDKSMYTCFTLHLRKNTNNQCSVHTSAYVKQGGVVDKVDKELCGGGEGSR